MAIVAGLSVTALDANAQNNLQTKLKQDKEKWEQEMAEFRARSEQRRELNELADSIAGVQAAAAVQNRDFVLETKRNPTHGRGCVRIFILPPHIILF